MHPDVRLRVLALRRSCPSDQVLRDRILSLTESQVRGRKVVPFMAIVEAYVIVAKERGIL